MKYPAIAAAFLTVCATMHAADEVVVTATKMQDPQRDVPASVSLVSGEALGQGAINADEALRSVSGISVLRNYGIGSGIPGQINVRGVPGLHGLLMLTDGYRLNEAATGFLSPNEIPVIAIERMEVVRGPFSSLYGADAFSGVVNMILKEPGGGDEFVVSAAVGNGGLIDFAQSISGKLGGCAYFAALQAVQMDNVLAQDEIIQSTFVPSLGAYADITKDAENFDYEDTRIIVKTACDFGENGHLNLLARYFDSELGMGQEDVRPLYPVLVDSDSATRSVFFGAEYQHQAGDSTHVATRLSYRDQRREVWGLDIAGAAGSIPIFAESYSRTDADEVELGFDVNVELSRKHIITAGLDARRTAADFGGLQDKNSGVQFAASTADSEAVENYGVFLQDSYTRGSVRLITGARIDSHSDFGEAVSPKAGVVWDVNGKTALRAAAGRAFRAPSLLELHQPAVGFGTVTFISNPELDPEYVNSVDMGVSYASDIVRVGVNLFYNDMEDLIGPRIDGQTYTYQNVSEAWSQGVELEASAEIADGITLNLSGTLQDAENETADTKLQHIPEELASAGIRYSVDLGACVASASVNGIYVGERSYVDDASGMWRELGAYFRTDASLQFEFNGKYSIGVNAVNALDEEYQESPVVNPAPGRVVSVRGGIVW